MQIKAPFSAIHHVTAVASSAAENLSFYTETLGLRLVKKTVNFDDPYTYHFYYGDGRGTPGTILTFFPWEDIPRGRAGAGMVTAVAFAAPHRAIAFWMERLSAAGISVASEKRFDETVLRFNDPHGLPLEIVGMKTLPAVTVWQDGPVEAANALAGFHSATETLRSLGAEQRLLADVMGLKLHGRQGNRYRFMTADRQAPGGYYDVVVDPGAQKGLPGSGTFHHIAFRCADDDAQAGWQAHLRDNGLHPTNVRDRNYFRSIYFRTPADVLFEIATDPPGFTVDEPLDLLGRTLKLPAVYELHRTEIVKRLPPLKARQFPYVFEPATGRHRDGHTIVTLHGTGGDERDLVGLAGDLFPSSAILSPRGQVLENGMPRFFKRLAPNRFDPDEVTSRAGELADFINETVRRYDRHTDRVTAFGYSNGANIAAAILLLHPDCLASAVLLRPMLPIQPAELPDLTGKQILIVPGSEDELVPSGSSNGLVNMLRRAGAEVTVIITSSGHALTPADAEAVRWWREEVSNCERKIFCDRPNEAMTA